MRIAILDGKSLNPGDLDWSPIMKLGETALYDETSFEDFGERTKDATVLAINKIPLKGKYLRKLSPSVRLIVSVLRFIDSTQYHSNEDDSNDAAHAKTPQELLREKRLSEQFRYKMLHEFGRRLRECGDETADCGKLLAQCFDQNNALRNETAQKQIKAYNEEIKTLMADDGKEMTTLTGLVDKIIKEYIAGSGNSGES